MFSLLTAIHRHPLYWLAIVITGLSMEAVALYYQYGLDYGPCTLCTHVRAWVLATVVVAMAGFFGRSIKPVNGICHLVMLGLAAGLLFSAWQLLGVERGFIEGSCDFDSGYPAWLPLHEWWPEVFEAWELCGYTPELLFGITMAEALIVFAVLVLAYFLLSNLVVLRSIWRS